MSPWPICYITFTALANKWKRVEKGKMKISAVTASKRRRCSLTYFIITPSKLSGLINGHRYRCCSPQTLRHFSLSGLRRALDLEGEMSVVLAVCKRAL